MTALFDWFSNNQALLTWMGIISFATFTLSLLSLPWLVAMIPEDYFLPKKRRPSDWKKQLPLLRLLVLIGKNLLGYILLIGGLLMIFLPGQGILTIAMGLLFTDYPGKFRLERKLASQPTILNGLNWLRDKANRPPLKVKR